MQRIPILGSGVVNISKKGVVKKKICPDNPVSYKCFRFAGSPSNIESLRLKRDGATPGYALCSRLYFKNIFPLPKLRSQQSIGKIGDKHLFNFRK